MVERRLPTEQLVREVRPPVTGERWISDTKQCGFGLRLWATTAGAGKKAYGVWIANKDGSKVRRTFQVRRQWSRPIGHDLSAYLGQAREWARDEIDIAKGRMTLDKERQIRRKHISQRMKKLTLGQAARQLLCGMRKEGLSEAYVDRLDKLFHAHVPSQLRALILSEVPPKGLARALAKLATKGGNLHILRPFVGQIYDRASEFEAAPYSYKETLTAHFWKEWRQSEKRLFPDLDSLTSNDLAKVYARLDAEEDRWQQACCLRLFLELSAPLQRVMAAQWCQVVGDTRWYPYLPEEKVYWFESVQTLNPAAVAIMARARNLAKTTVGESRYWFPSNDTHKPIATVQGLWRDTLKSVGSRYYPVGEFARKVRPGNTPSYWMGFIRQYGELNREINNVAEVSKVLYRQMANP